MRSHSSQSRAVILDIALGVTEACANVVRHAYPDGGGEVELEAVLEDGDLVCVSDAGVGFEHPPGDGRGAGCAVGGTLASTTIHSRPGGTRVQMRFALAAPPASAPG